MNLYRSQLRLGRVWWRASGETIEVLIPGMDPGVWVEVPLTTFDWPWIDGEAVQTVDLRRSPYSDRRMSDDGLYVYAQVNLDAECFEEIVIAPPFEVGRELTEAEKTQLRKDGFL